MTATGLGSNGGTGLEGRRRALKVLIARYDRIPAEREQLLAEIAKEQQRLILFKRGNSKADDALAWVDRWRPRVPRPSIFQSILAAL